MPRASFSSAAGVGYYGNTSVSGGSEGTSPTSNRTGGIDGGYGDDFGFSAVDPADGSDLGGRTREEKNDATPPWSDLKTKAGKERKRLPLACIACRRKKIRCSGERPACKHCIRSRIPCVYKVTTRKAAPRTDYMAMLDKRLKRMEERIIKIVPKEEQDGTILVTRATAKPGIPCTTTRNASDKKRGTNEAFSPELDSWAKSVSHAGLDGGSNSSSLMIQEAEENKLLSEGLDALPTKDIQEHLAEVFFENLYGQAYHLLHKPSFMRKLRAGTLPPVLILAVCAISARFSAHPKLNTTPAFLRGEAWASVAREIVVNRYEWPNITILTCLLILGLHEFGTCQGGRSWSFGGQAIRMAYALQLHRDLDHDPMKLGSSSTPLSFIDREIRRRTMWACFLMDRFNSSSTARPTFIREENLKIPLPVKEKYFQLDMPGPTENLKGEVLQPVASGTGELSNAKENMGVAAHIIRAIALWGRIINYFNFGGEEEDQHPMWHEESVCADLNKQAESFESTLPDSLQYTTENLQTHHTEGLDNQFLFLHISLQQNILFMNRFAVPGHIGPRSPADIPKDFVAKAGTKAFESANAISEIIRDGESYFVTAPFAGYCAFLSSTVHIFGVFSGNSSLEASSKKNLTTNVRYLAKMKRHWGMFYWMTENLKDQYRSYADTSQQGTTGSSAVEPRQIFQYGDWFDRYPHGVSQSDFEDPAVVVKKEKSDDAASEQKSDYHTVDEFFHTMSSHQQDPSRQQRLQAKRHQSMRKEQLNPVNTNNIPQCSPDATSAHIHNRQLPPEYSQMSPITPVGMYRHQTPYYAHDVILPPPQQGIMPHLDRQLVFGAYSDLDVPGPTSIDTNTGWDIQMNGMSGFIVEPSSAWFMPFNMESPEINQEPNNSLNTLGGAESSYDGGMGQQ
ncbi:zinc finger transcription factor 1 [Calycina marina]|uniref:Zinc finger transcription factor 1 n=1 Tax=Calycina marina TaxID=1763456 RepID=A0A9P7ZA04_9HELO|nr:zinc finger transcription factor 1 [Calycina marina]